MKIVLVNEKDQVIGYKERADSGPADIQRVSGLWIFNSQGEILIAQRSRNKTYSPGKWGPSAAGTIEEGETYGSNILKEAREELGVSLSEKDLIAGPHRFVEADHRYFYLMHFARVDAPLSSFVIQPKEVEQLKWIRPDELAAWLERSPKDFTASFKAAFDDYLRFSDSVTGKTRGAGGRCP